MVKMFLFNCLNNKHFYKKRKKLFKRQITYMLKIGYFCQNKRCNSSGGTTKILVIMKCDTQQDSDN